MSPDDNDGLFINTGTPISCSGTVTAWRFCYYTPVHEYNARPEKLSITFAVFQRTSHWTYAPILSSIITITKITSVGQDEDFVCETVELAGDNQFFVHEGDVIGVCLDTNDGPNLDPLNVISVDYQATAHLTYIPTPCRREYDVNVADKTVLSSRAMHVAVEFGKFTSIASKPLSLFYFHMYSFRRDFGSADGQLSHQHTYSER